MKIRHLLLGLAVVLAIAAPVAAQYGQTPGTQGGAPIFQNLTVLGTLTANSTVTTGAVVSGTGIVFDGATVDNFKTTLAITDPTANRTFTFPNGTSGTVMLSTLSTNAPTVANGVWAVSNGLSFEGATANAFNTTITPTDPTAARTLTLPDASGTFLVSTLATNAPTAANSVWAASNALVFEGATANAFNTSITPTDPTASRTITLPDASGTVAVTPGNLATGTVPVSASSGISFGTSSIVDNGTTVTITEPLVANGGVQGTTGTKALTSGAGAVAFVIAAIPSNSWAQLSVQYLYEVQDATPNFQAFGGRAVVNAVNKAGTITCTITTPSTAVEAPLAASSGTLTHTLSCADGTSGNLQVKATDTTSLTATVNRIRYRVDAMAPAALVITPQ